MQGTYFRTKVLPSQEWWTKQGSGQKLHDSLKACLNAHFDTAEKKIPLLIRRLVHFDQETRRWIESSETFNDTLLLLPTSPRMDIPPDVPIALQHSLNSAWIRVFEKALACCEEKIQARKAEFERLLNVLDTSRVMLSEEDVKNKARAQLPTGTNSVSTKKYLDWVQSQPGVYEDSVHHARRFWTLHRDQPEVWSELWRNPVKVKVAAAPGFIPVDLSAALLQAKLNGALEIFPKRGMYVGQWSLNSEQEQDWQLGLFTFLSRYAHEDLLPWKGEVSTEEKLPNQYAEHYQQSFKHANQTYYINVVDEKGWEKGFDREKEWIAHFVNQPPVDRCDNSITVVEESSEEEEGGIYENRTPIKLPSVKIYATKEMEANEEIFFNYHTTMGESYLRGPSFKDTRRRTYFFLPGGPFREWVKKNPKLLAQTLLTKMNIQYRDDFYWRKHQSPSPFSSLWKEPPVPAQ